MISIKVSWKSQFRIRPTEPNHPISAWQWRVTVLEMQSFKCCRVRNLKVQSVKTQPREEELPIEAQYSLGWNVSSAPRIKDVWCWKCLIRFSLLGALVAAVEQCVHLKDVTGVIFYYWGSDDDAADWTSLISKWQNWKTNCGNESCSEC